MRRAGLIAGCLLIVWAGNAAAAAGTPAGHRSALADVDTLDKSVSYSETKIPLGELVQKVADDTGAPLAAARTVADEPVAVVVKDLPARELLEQLADLLDYRWTRRGQEGAWEYELRQDLASKQREEALRRQMIAGVSARLRDQLREEGLMARLPQAQRQAIIDDFDRRSKELEKQTPDQQQAFYYSREGYEAYRRYIAASIVAKPIARVQADLLSRLSPEQWATLWSERSLVFSSQPAAGEFSLPAEIERQLRAARPSTSTIHILRMVQGTFVDQESPSEEDQRTSWATAAGYRVTVRLEASQQRSHGSLGLEASTQPILGAGAPEALTFRPGDSLDISVGAGDYDPLIQEETPKRRAALENDPLLGRRATFRPTAKPGEDADRPGTGSSWQACDLLPDLARSYGANVISDAYWGTDSVSSAQLLSEPQALYHVLDTLYLPRQRWDRRGNLIRLRSRTWFLERPRELPLRFVRRWGERYFERGGLSLDDYLEMATGLEESQLEALDEVVGILIRMRWLPRVAEELSVVHRARYALRLYASLSPEQRRQLAAGRDLFFTEITAAQRPLFLAALDDISIRNHAQSLASSTLVQWAETRFSVTSGRYTWVEMEDGGRFLRPEPASHPDLSNGAQGAGRPARPAPLTASASPPPVSRVPGRSGRPAIRWDAHERASLTRVEMELNAGPDLHEGFALPVASFP